MISPLLANLFLHYAFDEWMRRNHDSIPFERYADDILVHCKSEKQARWTKTVIERRLKECRLELHPETSTARMRPEEGTIQTRNLIFWGTRFGPGDQKIVMEDSL